MAEHLMVVLSNSKPELDEEFNDWYTNVHIVDVVDKLGGFASGQRFKAADDQPAPAQYRYLAIYRIPEGKLAEAQRTQRAQRQERAEALAAGREPLLPVRSELFDGPHHTWFYTSICDEYVGDPDKSEI